MDTSTKFALSTSFSLTCPSVSEAKCFLDKSESNGENFLSLLTKTPTSNFKWCKSIQYNYKLMYANSIITLRGSVEEGMEWKNYRMQTNLH